MHPRSLDRHVSRNHTDNPTFNCNQCGKSYARSGNLEMHKRTCTGPTVAAPAVKRRHTGDVVSEFTVRKTRKSLGGTAEMFAVDMKQANHLSALEEAVNALKLTMDVNPQLVNLVDVYEHNGSGWVFSNFASLQLTLWHLDPLRASAFVPLPRRIVDKKAVINIIGTGDDCF